MTIENESVPCAMTRVHFPLRIAFSMTINQSQGQTFAHVGLSFCKKAPFTHGQLYIACSRVTDQRNLIILCHNEKDGQARRYYYTIEILFFQKLLVDYYIISKLCKTVVSSFLVIINKQTNK